MTTVFIVVVAVAIVVYRVYLNLERERRETEPPKVPQREVHQRTKPRRHLRAVPDPPRPLNSDDLREMDQWFSEGTKPEDYK
jgi:hypothetical protein